VRDEDHPTAAGLDISTADLVLIGGLPLPMEDGPWQFDSDDILVIAMLGDPVYMPELLWESPGNHEYSGCYRVRDYQYQLNRVETPIERRAENYAIMACARAVGKTEGEKIHAQVHCFTSYENLLITAPELIHLLPLTDAVENAIRDCRLLVELLDTRNGQTGFTHRPFGVKFLDGCQIVGRIPKLTGTGVKGQHQPFLIVEEGQDYPEKGWIEVNPTVNYDTTDRDGRESFRFWIYGVHSGNKATSFDERVRSNAYRKIKVTRIMQPDWNRARKDAAKADYGGTSSPDYRRNILGEPGAGASAYFVTSRVMACVDQRVTREDVAGSDYNERIYQAETFRAEELASLGMDIRDLLDLPEMPTVWGGMDIGLTESPTVISLFADMMHQGFGEKKARMRRALIRRYTLERFRPKDIRAALYAIGFHYGSSLKGFGIDITGLGFPIFQDMEDDELCPPHLLEVTEGYFFNSKVPVGVDPTLVTEHHGLLKDHLGNLVKRVEDELTNTVRYVVYMPFIAASTRFVREDIDSHTLLLPFDTEVTSDVLGETKQRVEAIGRSSGATKKGDRFHILDSFRAMAMRTRKDQIEESIAVPEQQAVLDIAF
jgi:hypothetical protein